MYRRISTIAMTLSLIVSFLSPAYVVLAAPCSVATLIADINAANSSGQPSTISLGAGCTYSLTSAAAADPDGYGPVGLPPITGDITIQSNGATITRTGVISLRLFYVTTGGHLTLDNLTLSNGLAQGGIGGNAYYDGGGGGAGLGGAILNRGVLAISDATLSQLVKIT